MPRYVSIPTRPLLWLVITLALVIIGTATVVAAATKSSGGQLLAVKTATESSQVMYEFNLNTWTDVSGMSVSVTVPDREKALLVIEFSSETRCVGIDKVCRIRATVDGVVVPPGDVRFGGTDNNDYNLDAATHSMQWVRTSLEPGSHTVKVQLWRGNLTVFKNRTLTVLQFVQGPTRVV